MAVEIFKLFGSIFVNNDEANKSIAKTDEKASGVANTLGNGVKKAAKWGAAIGAATLAAGTAAVNAAADYETSFAKVSTLLSGTQSDIEQYKKDIISASNETGLSAEEMSESVYSAISAGVNQADAINFTTDALKLAKGGFTKTATAVDVLSTALNAYGMESDQASRVSDVLITTQNLGKTTVDELASSMGKVIPLASAYGVNIENLGASYATLTAGGIATSEATTYMKSMMSELAKESSKVSTVLKDKTGKSFSELMNSGYSMGDVLQTLSDSVDGNSTAFANLWSSTEAGTGALAIVNAGADSFNETLGQMQNAAGATESAYDKMSNTLESRLTKLKTNATNMLTSMGESILPFVEKMVDGIIDYMPQIQSFLEKLTPLISDFFEQVLPPLMELMQSILPLIMQLLESTIPIIGQLFNSIAPIIVQIVEQLLPPLLQIIEQILPPILDIITALMPLLTTIFDLLSPLIDVILQLVGVLLDSLLSALTPIIEYLAQFLNDLLQPLIPIFTEIGQILSETLSPIFEVLGQVLTKVFDALKPVLDLFGQLISAILPALTPLIQMLADVFSGVLGAALEAVSGILDSVMDIFGGLIDFITGVFTGNWEQAWDGIVGIFKGIFNLIPTIIEFIINGAIGLINGLLSGINWAIEWIGWEIPMIPEVTLPRFRAGIDYVPNDKFPAYLDAGEAVLTASEAEQYRQAKRESGGYSPFANQQKEQKTINQTFNVTVNVDKIKDSFDIDKLAVTISEKLAEEIKRKEGAYA